ncbi:hypothetical protein MLD38_007431 [Melastoma candidum]|uniref:Uncharacterized protein n=1 Tax=Melastoma candidum TaxID=119954 RepID=A0ACB9RZN3_9MYRT|nr:hypothetical protein MLD38_007431 [Melastoma candidum]
MEGAFQNLPASGGVCKASFSSCLNANVECFPSKVAGDPYDEDGEIGVFEAEKYFNGLIDEDILSPGYSVELQQQQEPMKSSSSQMSGMTRSTGSLQSWDSRALLLRRQRQQQQPRKVSEIRSKSLLAFIICCRCGCDGDDSGDVRFRDGHEGFDPRGQWPPDFVLEKKLTMLPWSDVVPRKEDQNAPDSCSDATSDLFEIESLTGKGSRLLTWHDAASVGDHAPSEASVEWSVVTESAAATEFSFDDRSELTGKTTSTEWRWAKGSNKRSRKEQQRNGILLRC